MFVDKLIETEEIDIRNSDPYFLANTLKDFKFDYMRDLGKDRCGYNSQASAISKTSNDNIVYGINVDGMGRTCPDGPKEPRERSHYSCEQIVLHLRRSTPKIDRVLWENDKETKRIVVSDANGSIKNIREWSKAAFGSDKKLQRDI